MLMIGNHSARMKHAFFTNSIGVWVYLDSQLEEAKKLINDPDYEVRCPVDMEQFKEQLQQVKMDGEIKRHFNGMLNKVIASALILLLALIAYNMITT